MTNQAPLDPNAQTAYFVNYEWMQLISPLAAGVNTPGRQPVQVGRGIVVTTEHPLIWMMNEWRRRKEVSIHITFWKEIPVEVGIQTRAFLDEMREKAEHGMTMH